MAHRRFPPPWTVEELDVRLLPTTALAEHEISLLFLG
jgi:hypothetical protein